MAASKSIREVRRGQYVSIASHEWSDSARVGGRSPNDGGPARLAIAIVRIPSNIARDHAVRLLLSRARRNPRRSHRAPPTRRETMAESLTMTRGQLHDLLARFAVENPKYRDALINDPKMVLEKQLGHSLGKISVKSVIE